MEFLKKNRKKVLIVLGALILLFIVFRILKPRRSFKTSSVQKGDVRQELTLSGEIDSSEKVALSFQTGGKLAWVGVKEGDFVYKSQGIASLSL